MVTNANNIYVIQILMVIEMMVIIIMKIQINNNIQINIVIVNGLFNKSLIKNK